MDDVKSKVSFPGKDRRTILYWIILGLNCFGLCDMLCLIPSAVYVIMRFIVKKSSIALLICLVCLGRLPGSVEFPLVQSFSFFPFVENKTLEKKRFSLSLHTAYSNIYALDFEEMGVNDFEMVSFSLLARFGLLNQFTLELTYRYFYVYGGFLDGAVEAFHELFKLPDARRDEYPIDEVNYYYRHYFQYSHSTGGSSPLLFSVLKKFVNSKKINVQGRLFLGIPFVSKPGFVSDKLFWGAGLIFTSFFNDFWVEASVHFSFFRRPEWIDEENLGSMIYLYKLQLGHRRIYSGFIVKTTPFKEGYYSRNAHQVYLGFKVSRSIEVGISEDLPPFDTTPDIHFYFIFRIF